MLKATKQMLSQGDGWKNPFGDGKQLNPRFYICDTR